VQHRETQGNESPAFLALFPTFMVLDGGVDSGFTQVRAATYAPRLLHIKGDRKRLVVRQVPLSHASLNGGDVFVCDLGLKILQWRVRLLGGAGRAALLPPLAAPLPLLPCRRCCHCHCAADAALPSLRGLKLLLLALIAAHPPKNQNISAQERGSQQRAGAQQGGGAVPRAAGRAARRAAHRGVR